MAKQIFTTSLSSNVAEANIFNHGGNVLRYGYKSGIIDFSANINPLGLSKKAIKILKNSQQIKFFIENYPEIYPVSFINTLSDYHCIDKKFIFPGAGATDLIFSITDILKPKTVVIAEPSFSEYERASLIKESDIIHLHTYITENFELKGKSLLNLFDNIKSLSKNDLVFLASPSNPVGTITQIETIIEILNRLKPINAILVLDESFMDFCEEFSSKNLINSFDNLIILRSMTKFFAMPGQRLGYIFANPKIITKLTASAAPWKTASLGTAIASAVLNDRDYILNSRHLLAKSKECLLNKLKKLKSFETIPCAANYFLINIKTNKFNAVDLKNYLLESGILIRNCADYHGLNDKYFRIAVKKKSENDYLIKKLKEFLIYKNCQ